MFEALRRRLTISAAGRNLAVDLAERHGVDAMRVVECELAVADLDAESREVLEKSLRALGRLVVHMAD